MQYASQLSLGVQVITKNAGAIPSAGGDQVSMAINLMSKIPLKQADQFLSLMKSADVTNLGSKAVEVKDMAAVLRPLNLFKGTAVANTALAGATVIAVAFAIIQSVAIDQFIAIQTARPKLEGALAVAQQPITVNDILSQPNGSDVLLYHWSKSMESEVVFNDPQTVALAGAAYQQAQSASYRLVAAQ